jgi:gentisate 1,2-dioxygenase
MQELGRLEDLPESYRNQLKELNLVPLWPSLRAVLPPQVPTRHTQPTHWPYQSLKPLLLQAGELTPVSYTHLRAHETG